MIVRVIALCVLSGGGIAQDMSSLTGKLDLSGGRFDSTSGKRVSGSLAGAFSAGFGWGSAARHAGFRRRLCRDQV